MKRERVTITIREELLRRVDDMIDNEKIRTRSHAVEYLLTQSLKSSVRTALVLAGGKGVRLKPLTEELPKSLLPVRAKPILEYQVELLRSAEVRNIFILVGHLGERIKYHFGDGSRLGVHIRYIEQGEGGIGTGHALWLAKNYLSETFLLFYGDVLFDMNLADFMRHHDETGSMATMALTSMKYPSEYGVAKLRGSKIVEFTEKPRENAALSRVVSAGIFTFAPAIFDYLPKRPDLALERDVFPKLAGEEKLTGYLFEGQWFDIGTQEIYARAIREWRK